MQKVWLGIGKNTFWNFHRLLDSIFLFIGSTIWLSRQLKGLRLMIYTWIADDIIRFRFLCVADEADDILWTICTLYKYWVGLRTARSHFAFPLIHELKVRWM